MLTVGAREPSAARSTHPLFDLEVAIGDEAPQPAIAKRAPEREIRAYRTFLAGGRFGAPRYLGVDGGLLLLEAVDGTPLWQCELPPWLEAARCLGRLHAHASAQDAPAAAGWWTGPPVDAPNPQLATAQRHGREVLSRQPLVLVHGEAYPANVLVRPDGSVCLLDWESAAPGPAAIDLAALTAGWDAADATAMRLAYAEAAGAPLTDAAMAAAELIWALRWLTWPQALAAPSGAVDWSVEASRAAKELECAR